MQADFSVEIGPDADALELPWASPDGTLRYFDLKNRPELLLEVREAHDNRALAEFLAAINARPSVFRTAKCDTWSSAELNEAEQVYGAAAKYCSYVDLVFDGAEARASFAGHEEFAGALCGLLAKAPEISAAAEFIIRRCYVHQVDGDGAVSEESSDAYCVTFELSGYGDEEAEARKRWTIGMKLVENAILQWSARRG